MKKRFLCAVLAAVIAISGCSKTKNEAETTDLPADNTASGENPQFIAVDDLTPAVWTATDPESGNKINLMGTIHMVPKREKLVPDYIMDVYNSSDIIAVEYDISKIQTDAVVQLMYLSYYILNDGTTIADHLSPETYEKAKAHLTETEMYNPAFDSYNSAYWESLVMSSALLSYEDIQPKGIDSYFVGTAKADGKEVRSIEALETQMNVIISASDEFNEYNILSILDAPDKDELHDSFIQLYNLWGTGELEKAVQLEAESAEELPDELKEEYEIYNQNLTAERNKGMARKAAEYIENGENVFFMVGFMHFCGEDSVIDLLEDMGYVVERIH